MAVATWPRSLPITVRSAASMATSVPEPMAMPRSACASAGGVVHAVPGHGHRGALRLEPLTASTLPSGRTSASTSSGAMPTASATRAATTALSPVSRTGRRPRARSRAMAAAEPGLDGVLQADDAGGTAVHRHQDGGGAGLLFRAQQRRRCPGQRDAVLLQPARAGRRRRRGPPRFRGRRRRGRNRTR